MGLQGQQLFSLGSEVEIDAKKNTATKADRSMVQLMSGGFLGGTQSSVIQLTTVFLNYQGNF